MQGPYREILSPRFWSTDWPFVRDKGLAFHGTGQAIQVINSLLWNIPNIHREFASSFPKKNFSQNYSKIIFPTICSDFQIFLVSK